MEIGIDSFIMSSVGAGSLARRNPVEVMREALDRIVLADQVGLGSFGIGEHHRQEFLDSAPTVILAAAAALTTNIRLTSAVVVLGAIDPVRLFQSFATLDAISGGRAEIVVGRGSFVEAFSLFGRNLSDYDALFAENLGLLLELQRHDHVTWSGRFRAPLTGQGVYPRPVQNRIPVWLGVGGTPQSFVRAGTLGLPLMLAVIGGETHRYRPLVDLYREAGHRAGHAPESLRVGLHSWGYIAPSSQEAAEDFYPGYVRSNAAMAKERGWPLVTKAQFDSQLGSKGAYLIGSPQQVSEKIALHVDALGGVARVTLQMDIADLPHDKLLRSIELLGTRVAPSFS